MCECFKDENLMFFSFWIRLLLSFDRLWPSFFCFWELSSHSIPRRSDLRSNLPEMLILAFSGDCENNTTAALKVDNVCKRGVFFAGVMPSVLVFRKWSNQRRHGRRKMKQPKETAPACSDYYFKFHFYPLLLNSLCKFDTTTIRGARTCIVIRK